MRICVFSERLQRPYDEGIKNVAVHLIETLAKAHEVLAVTCDGQSDTAYGIQNVSANRLLLSPQLGKMIRQFRPQAIVYVPTACATVFSFARAKLLRAYGRKARTALVTLQPRSYTPIGEFLIRRLAPDWVLAQSNRTLGVLHNLGCHTALFPPAVDTERFRPALPQEREELRRMHGIPSGVRIVTHVGHLKSKRKLTELLTLQSLPGYHTVVVASTSTVQDEPLKQTLRAAGITVIDTYVAQIEDIYRLSDIYLFLAEQPTAAIEVPLSVLEAMACNLPVISTPFGGLQVFFADTYKGLYYWDGETRLGDVVESALSAPSATRTLVEPYTWAAAAETLIHLFHANEVARA